MPRYIGKATWSSFFSESLGTHLGIGVYFIGDFPDQLSKVQIHSKYNKCFIGSGRKNPKLSLGYPQLDMSFNLKGEKLENQRIACI